MNLLTNFLILYFLLFLSVFPLIFTTIFSTTDDANEYMKSLMINLNYSNWDFNEKESKFIYSNTSDTFSKNNISMMINVFEYNKFIPISYQIYNIEKNSGYSLFDSDVNHVSNRLIYNNVYNDTEFIIDNYYFVKGNVFYKISFNNILENNKQEFYNHEIKQILKSIDFPYSSNENKDLSTIKFSSPISSVVMDIERNNLYIVEPKSRTIHIFDQNMNRTEIIVGFPINTLELSYFKNELIVSDPTSEIIRVIDGFNYNYQNGLTFRDDFTINDITIDTNEFDELGLENLIFVHFI